MTGLGSLVYDLRGNRSAKCAKAKAIVRAKWSFLYIQKLTFNFNFEFWVASGLEPRSWNPIFIWPLSSFRLFSCPFVHLCVCTHLAENAIICPFIRFSICLPFRSSVHSSVCLSVCLFVLLFVCPFVCLSVCLFVCSCVRLFVLILADNAIICPFILYSICLSVHSFVHLSICQFVCWLVLSLFCSYSPWQEIQLFDSN